MSPDKKIEQILKNCNKNYEFNEKHDKKKPLKMWFQDSEEGKVLFIVFYTQACRWSQCTGCNLPSAMSQYYVDYKNIIAQIDYIFNQQDVQKESKNLRKVILSNNGSILDEKTFSSTALIYLIAKLNIHFPNLDIVSIETRPEYVDLSELEFLSRALKEGDTPTNLEIAIGFEAFDDHIRNEIFKKGLDLKVLEDLAKKLSEYHFHLKCYFMQKPISGMTDKEAIEDIKKGIDYLSKLSKKYNLKINMHLNPTYVARGTVLEQDFQKRLYTPPKLIDVVESVKHAKDKKISIFVGLYDEGLATKGGSFIRDGDEEIIKKLNHFNKTQNYSLLSF